jgi:hypothetical protein
VSYAPYIERAHQALVGSFNGSGFDALPSFGGTDRPLVSGSTPFTRGAWLEVTPALPFTTSRVRVDFNTANATAEAAVAIAIGASGQEVAVIEGVPVRSDNQHGRFADLPLELPAGARVSMAIQSSHTDALSIGWTVALTPKSPRAPVGFPRWTRLNLNLADHTFATAHPGPFNVRSAWMELVTALPQDVPLALVAISTIISQGGGNSVVASLALGAASQEVPVAHLGYARMPFARFGSSVHEVSLSARLGQRLSWSAVSEGGQFGLIVFLPY